MRFHLPPIWERDGVIAGFVLRPQFTTVTDVLTRDGIGPDGEPVTETVFVDHVVASLTPLLSRGVLFAQSTMWRPSSTPTVGAAPASAKSYLHYNSSTGLYWSSSRAATTSGDALIGWVVTDGTGVVLTSSRVLGDGAEATIPAPGVEVAGAGSDAVDADVPDAPAFGVDIAPLESTAVEVDGLAIAHNAHSVSVGEFTFYYVDPAAADYLLSSSLTTGAASVVCASTPTTIAAGDYIQIGAELLLCGAPSGSTIPVTRAQLGPTAATAAAGDVVSKVVRRVVTAAFAAGFFDSAAAADWVLSVSLPETRLVAVRGSVTNAYGAATTDVCVTGNASHGLILTAAAAGSAADAVRNLVNADVTLSAGAEIIDVTATTRDCVITLPPASSMQGLTKTLRLAYGSTHTASFAPGSGDTIAGSSSNYGLSDPGSSVTIEAVGADWAIVAGAGSLTAATVADAENVDSSTSVGVDYGMWGNASAYALTASIVLPSTRPNLKKIHVVVDGAGGTLIEMGTLYAPWSSSPVAWRSGDTEILQAGASVTRTLKLLCENAAGAITASPVTKTVTVRASKADSVTAAEVGTRYAEAGNRLVHLTVGLVPVLNGGQVPQVVTYWLSADNGTTYTWIGWQTMSAVGQTLKMDRLVPGSAGTWKVAAAAGAIGGDGTVAIAAASLPASAAVSSGFSVAGIAAPAAGVVTGISAGTITAQQDLSTGWQWAELDGVSWTDPTDTSWLVKFYVRETDSAGSPASDARGQWREWFEKEVRGGARTSIASNVGPLQIGYRADGDTHHYIEIQCVAVNLLSTNPGDWVGADTASSVAQGSVMRLDFGVLPAGALDLSRANPATLDPSLIQRPDGLGVNTSNFSNMVLDGSFEDVNGTAWVLQDAEIAAAAPLTGANAAWITPRVSDGGGAVIEKVWHACIAGEEFATDAYVISSPGMTGTLRLALVFRDAAGSALYAPEVSTADTHITDIGYKHLSLRAIAPASTSTVNVQIYCLGGQHDHYWTVDNVFLCRQIPAGPGMAPYGNGGLTALLGDAVKFDGSNQITLDLGGGVKVTSGKLTADLGVGVKLTGNQVTLDLGTGLVISGTQVQANLGNGLTVSGGQIVVNLGNGLAMVGTQVTANLGNGLTSSAGQITVNLGNGLTMVGSQVTANLGNGLTLSGSAITVNLGQGLTLSGSQVRVNTGLGLTLVGGEVRASLGNGLTFSGSAVQVNTGNGLTMSGSALTLDLGNGLVMSGTHATVNLGNGLTLSGSQITLSLGSGLSMTGSTLTANLGNGLTASGGQITVNLGAGLTLSGSAMTVNTGGGLTLSGFQIVIATNGVTSSQILSLDVSRLNAGTMNVGSGGMTFSGSGGISIFGGGSVSVTPGNVSGAFVQCSPGGAFMAGTTAGIGSQAFPQYRTVDNGFGVVKNVVIMGGMIAQWDA